jgi:peptidoglycan/LPS O-acetylase OafA/YrhL
VAAETRNDSLVERARVSNARLPRAEATETTKKTGYIQSLDGFRALSVGLIILCHAAYNASRSEYISAFTPYFDGAVAVRIFFIVSGFLITGLLISEKNETGNVSLGNFYFRRFLRIFPVQATYVFFLFIIDNFSTSHINSCEFFTSIFYMKNYACYDRLDGHFWTLSVEEQFYLFWPFLFAFLDKKLLIYTASGLIICASISRVVQYKLGDRDFWWLTSNVDALMLGCMAATVSGSARFRRIFSLCPSVGRLFAIIFITIPDILSNHLWMAAFTVTLGPTLQDVCVVYLICSCIYEEKGILYRLLNNPVMIFVGKKSYSIYVWQQFFIFATFADFGFQGSVLFHFPVNVSLAFLGGIALYYAVERPMMKVRKYLCGSGYGVARGGGLREISSTSTSIRAAPESLAAPMRQLAGIHDDRPS